MDRNKLRIAVEEARRFISRAEALPPPTAPEGDYQYLFDSFPKEKAAIKRASMDLTRALADLRKPQS